MARSRKEVKGEPSKEEAEGDGVDGVKMGGGGQTSGGWWTLYIRAGGGILSGFSFTPIGQAVAVFSL